MKKLVLESSEVVNNAAEAAGVFARYFKQFEVEHFAVIYLDRVLQIINGVYDMAVGDETRVVVPFEEVIKTGKELGAEYVVLAHNHPVHHANGMALSVVNPSVLDVLTILSLTAELRKVGITLLDGLVIGYNGDVTSVEDMMKTATQVLSQTKRKQV